MSLLDEWETGRVSIVDDIGRNLAVTSLADDSQDEYPGSPTIGQDRGLCALEPVDRQLTRFEAHHKHVGVAAWQQDHVLCITSCPVVWCAIWCWLCHRGRGNVTAVAAGSECILVATSRAVLLRYDLSIGLLPGGAVAWGSNLSTGVTVLPALVLPSDVLGL